MRILTTVEAAKQLNVSQGTVLNLVRSGELTASRLTKQSWWRIRQDDLIQFAEERGITLEVFEEEKSSG